jgi:hypothetical protein
MKLRTVIITEVKLLFDWANELSVRCNAINTSQIEWVEQIVWFERKFQTKKSFNLKILP